MDNAKELSIEHFVDEKCDLTVLRYYDDGFRIRLRVFPGSVLGSAGTFWTNRFSDQKVADKVLTNLKNEIGQITSGQIENKILAHFSALRFDQPLDVVFKPTTS